MVGGAAIFDALGDIQVNSVAVNAHSVCATGTEKLVQKLNETGIGRWNPGGGLGTTRNGGATRGIPTEALLYEKDLQPPLYRQALSMRGIHRS